VATPVSQSSRHARETRHSLGGEQLEPLSLRLLQAAGVLSLLLILVVANSLLNSGGESPFDPNPVAAAAERTQAAPGMRFDMTMQFKSDSGKAATITGDGSYSGEDNLASVAYHADGSSGALDFDGILSEDAWYFRYPQLAAKMPEGKEWIKLQGLPGQREESQMGVESPEETLRILGASGTVTRIGQVKVRKVPTTRYRTVLPMDKVAEVLRSEGKDELAEQLESPSVQVVGPVRGEVFIDRHGLLRRVRTLATVSANGTTVTTAVRMDLFDFGVKPDIQIPDDSQTFDMTPVLEEKMNALGQPS